MSQHKKVISIYFIDQQEDESNFANTLIVKYASDILEAFG